MTDFRAVTPKPPLGLRPRWILDLHRTNEILSAMQRYAEACLPLPQEWMDELNELASRNREANQIADDLEAQP